MTVKYTLEQYLDNECTRQEWIDSHSPIQLELGGVYIQAKGTWHETHFKIVFVDDKIAVGIAVKGGANLSTGRYELFYKSNGFKYDDMCRPVYRLSAKCDKIAID